MSDKGTKLRTVFVNEDYRDIPEESVLVVDSRYTSHRCPCGCGMTVMLPIGQDGWTLTRDGDLVTLNPSIFNHPCQAHYFIKNSEVVWVGR
jgi:hypothetical protein